MAITRIGGANAITGTLPAANIDNTSIGSVTALPAGVGGKVLQIQTHHFSSAVNTTSTSFGDTGITKAITPSATSSKILVTVALKLATSTDSNERINTQILRGSTVVALNERTLLSNDSATQAMVGYQFLDSPSSSSELTYKIQWRCINGITVKLNDYEGTGSFSSLTLMEIGA